MRYNTIHLWGDSLGKGVVFDDQRRRYCITPHRCAIGLQEALEVPVANHSRMGATSVEGFAGFMEAVPEPGALVVIEYGGNDCDMPWTEVASKPEADYQGRIPIAEFTDTLRLFIQAVRAREMIPLLVTPPPLDADRYFAWVTQGIDGDAVLRFLGDVQHIYRWQERYAVAIRNVAYQENCMLFDMRDAFLAQRRYPAMLCTDGIHLNEAGHAVIVQAVLQARAQLSAETKTPA